MSTKSPALNFITYHCLVFTTEVLAHLRLRFSLLLMPVFWWSIFGMIYFVDPDASFMLSFGIDILLGFIVWHLLIYPASNAYNSYQDQDKGSIGDLKNPTLASKEVFYWSILLNGIGVVTAFFISKTFGLGVLVYIIVSQLYSWRGFRLKRYPILGFLSVFIFQGFWVVMINRGLCLSAHPDEINYLLLAMAASFMFGGGYPITQIYQHKQDREDGVKTISMLLGVKGTLVFSGIMNAIGLILLSISFINAGWWFFIPIYLLMISPTFYHFYQWNKRIQQNESEANFENVMKMTWISAICNNLAIIMLIFVPKLISFF